MSQQGEQAASGASPKEHEDRPIDLRIGREELVIRGRYETLSIANDVLIGLVFLVGSFFFFSDRLMTDGTWLFVVGSVLMLIRPSIRLARRFHLQRLNPQAPTDTPRDY